MPSVNEEAEAEKLKAEGNALFARQKYAAAAEKYTEGLVMCPAWPVLWVNRAMCHRKREDFGRVLEDSRQALALDPGLMKAHYLLGLAYMHRGEHEEACRHLAKALEAARESGDAIKDDIWHELARAKYQHWQQESAARKGNAARLKQQLQQLSQGDPALQAECEALLAAAAKQDVPVEVPSIYMCPLTMEVFREPVITPYGLSYERSALLEHMRKVGRWDPITRKPLSEEALVANLALRTAIQVYLDEHPWAWGDCT